MVEVYSMDGMTSNIISGDFKGGIVGIPEKDYMGGEMGGMDGMDDLATETKVPMTDKLMSSWLFVGGVSAGVLILGVVFGIIAGRHRVKKGFDLYED